MFTAKISRIPQSNRIFPEWFSCCWRLYEAGSLSEQQEDEISCGEKVHISYGKNGFQDKVRVVEVKKQAKTMNDFTEGVPQVEKEFYGYEDEHEPVSLGSASEKEDGGEEEECEDEEHNESPSCLGQWVVGVVVKAKEVWYLGDEVGQDQ